MGPLSDSIILKFAEHFASGRRGFSLNEIAQYFSTYEPNIPSPGSRPMVPLKPDFFKECLLALHPVDQRIALLDLCNSHLESKHTMPNEKVRLELKKLLFQAHGLSPVGMGISRISVRGLRESWWEISSRMPDNPPAAITSARTLLESTCKTILNELGEPFDTSGDLNKLFKQTTKSLGISKAPSENQIKLQIMNGIVSIVSGISGLSNLAGDRHGLIAGENIKDVHIAELAINTCGTLAVFLSEIFSLRNFVDKGSVS